MSVTIQTKSGRSVTFLGPEEISWGRVKKLRGMSPENEQDVEYALASFLKSWDYDGELPCIERVKEDGRTTEIVHPNGLDDLTSSEVMELVELLLSLGKEPPTATPTGTNSTPTSPQATGSRRRGPGS